MVVPAPEHRVYSSLLRNSMVGGRVVTPEAVVGGWGGKMAARGALGAVCRRLWQQVPGMLGELGAPTGTLLLCLAASRRSGHQEPSPILFCTLARLQQGGKKGASFILISHGVKLRAKTGTKRRTELEAILDIIRSNSSPLFTFAQ